MKTMYRFLVGFLSLILHGCGIFSLYSLLKVEVANDDFLLLILLIPFVFVAVLQPVICKLLKMNFHQYYISSFIGLFTGIITCGILTIATSQTSVWFYSLLTAAFLMAYVAVEAAVVYTIKLLVFLYKKSLVKGIIATVAVIIIVLTVSQSLFIGYKYYYIDSEYAKEAIVGSSTNQILRRYGRPDYCYPDEEPNDTFSGTLSYEKDDYIYTITFDNGIAVDYRKRFEY